MDMVAVSVGRTARAWDEQHLDLHAAAGQVAAFGGAGFTTEVAGAAGRFARAWERHTERAATRCEERADGLRATLADWWATDGRAADSVMRLAPYLSELR